MTAATLPRHRHRKPRLHKRLLARLRRRRQAEDIEIAHHDAHMVRVAAHAPPPTAWAGAALAARIAAYSEALDGLPPAAVLPDEADDRWPHLGEGQYSGDDTQAFGLSIMKAGQQWMP